SGKSCMNDGGESYCGVVPTKQPNKSGNRRRRLRREDCRPRRTRGSLTCAGLRAWKPGQAAGACARNSEEDGKLKFTALLHHVSLDLLRDSYYSVEKQAAPGVDGMTWQAYGGDLEARLADLHGRIHRGAYRAQPSRRVWIPKADGRQRPLGIAALEDKIV